MKLNELISEKYNYHFPESYNERAINYYNTHSLHTRCHFIFDLMLEINNFEVGKDDLYYMNNEAPEVWEELKEAFLYVKSEEKKNIINSLTSNQLKLYNKCINELDLDNAHLSLEYYYNHLPLCIIDAVFSIGVRYSSTRKTVIRFCEHESLQRLASPNNQPTDSYTTSDLLRKLSQYSDFGAKELFKNHQKTSTNNGILKSIAVYKFSKVLEENNIQTLSDIRSANSEIINIIERGVKQIPGQKSGISFSYFLMLSGSDDNMKIDRWLLRFVGEALGVKKYSNVEEAHRDLQIVLNALKTIYPHLTPRLLDHTIWSYMKIK